MNWRLLSKFLCKFPIWISCAIGYHTDRIGGVATGVFVRLHFVPPRRRPARVVRQRPLKPPFEGSNPSSPAMNHSLAKIIAAGRSVLSHCGGQGFESPQLHQNVTV